MKPFPTTPEQALVNLYLGRLNAKAARRQWVAKLDQVGRCQGGFYGTDEGPACYSSGRPIDQWCESCKTTDPLYREYRSAVRSAAGALLSASRLGRRCFENSQQLARYLTS